MMLPPREPQSHDKAFADWARDVIRYLKAITPMPGKGCKIERKPTGSFITAAGGGSSGGGSSAADKGCFRISATDGLDVTFVNLYYMIGGRLYSFRTVEEITITLSEETPLAALRLAASEEIVATSLDDPEFADPSVYLLPLYLFDVDDENESCSVKIDMRNIPTAVMFEYDQ